jgi:carbamoyltransferase
MVNMALGNTLPAANNFFVLGINGGVRPGYQDISTVLMCNGVLLAAIEEERLTRVKHVAGQFPVLSIKEILSLAGIEIRDVSLVALHGSTWQTAIDDVLKLHFESHFGYCPPVKRYHHHQCHAASAYYASGFEEALVITIDGSGDGISTRISIADNKGIRSIKEFARPQSLGLFYSMMTQLCGFIRDADEYKLMGLAAYGNHSAFDLDNVLPLNDDGYYFNTDYMIDIPPGQPSPGRYEMLYNQRLLDKLNLKRRTSNDIPQTYRDVAAAAQRQLEKAIIHLVKIYIKQTGIQKVCMAGGVALNCLANQKIEALPEVDELFIQPASSDSGISLGAAYLASIERGFSIERMTHVFYGSAYTDEAIESVLINCHIDYRKADNIVEEAASALAENKVIGWFQGAMEFGPRALGSRSILANAASENIQSVVNHKVKFREGFRPFGASVLEEDFHYYFEAKCSNGPFMTKVVNVKPLHKILLKGVTHADGTCRVQTINIDQHKKFYELLSAFKQKTGVGVLLNTSFNLNYEPIVCKPREAIASFFASGLDVLFIGSFVVQKSK